MKFKRDWKVVYRDIYLSVSSISIFLLFVLFVPLLESGDYKALLSSASIFLIFISMCIFCYYSTGIFTNIIILDDEGIIFQQKKQPPLQIRWEEIGRIVRTRYIGGKAIVFWDIYGQEIWFYNSRKIEGYILSQHPELKSLFPKENDYRKWQQWDKKLRF